MAKKQAVRSFLLKMKKLVDGMLDDLKPKEKKKQKKGKKKKAKEA